MIFIDILIKNSSFSSISGSITNILIVIIIDNLNNILWCGFHYNFYIFKYSALHLLLLIHDLIKNIIYIIYLIVILIIDTSNYNSKYNINNYNNILEIEIL